MAKTLNLEIVDDPLISTHVLAGDASRHLRRTPKLMAALCVTPNIVKTEWLEESYKSKSLLNCSHFLLLNDTYAEKAYSFSMKNTLREGNERRSAGGLLAGWRVLFCDGVAGNRAPKEIDLRMMVKAAGGVWMEKSEIPVPITDDPTHVIAITSDPPLSTQLSDANAQVAADNGAGFFTTSWLFDCMMHQKVSSAYLQLNRNF